MNTFFCRAFQCCFAVGARFLPWRTPEAFSGEGSLLRAADILRENGLRRPFVIASRRQCADEHFRALQEKLDEQDILLSIFSSVEPNPSVETVEKIAAQYKLDGCDCFLVIGGGSPHILSISLPGYRSEVLMNFLEARGIYTSKSSACKKGGRSHVLEAIELPANVIDGALRISFSRYTTREDIDALCDALRDAKQSLFPSLH